MAKLVFRLNHVPDREADAIRKLLSDHNFDYYETHAGRWGFSVAALWLKNNDDFDEARAIIDEFQEMYTQESRDLYETEKRAGRIPTFWQLLASNPLLFLSYWALIIAVAVLTVLPMFVFF